MALRAKDWKIIDERIDARVREFKAQHEGSEQHGQASPHLTDRQDKLEAALRRLAKAQALHAAANAKLT